MRFTAARAVLPCLVLVGGCGMNMPSVSTVVPNWPQNPNMTPEETRRIREQELALYTTKKPAADEPAAPASPPVAAKPASAPAPAPASGSQSSTTTTAPSGRKFEVAPELVGQGPVPPRSPARDTTTMAALAPSASAAASKTPVQLAPGTPAARYGDLIFISGQLPIDSRGNPTPSDARFEDQARLALENVRGVLESNRLSMANIVSMTVYLRDLDDAKAFEPLFASYFKGSQPARSIVEVSRLPSNARIEISAVAGR